jgi:hypothetical protein
MWVVWRWCAQAREANDARSGRTTPPAGRDELNSVRAGSASCEPPLARSGAVQACRSAAAHWAVACARCGAHAARVGGVTPAGAAGACMCAVMMMIDPMIMNHD